MGNGNSALPRERHKSGSQDIMPGMKMWTCKVDENPLN